MQSSAIWNNFPARDLFGHDDPRQSSPHQRPVQTVLNLSMVRIILAIVLASRRFEKRKNPFGTAGFFLDRSL